MPIQASRLTVHLPAEFGDVFCAVGQGVDGRLYGETARTTGSSSRPGALGVNTPVTVRTTLDMAAPERDRLPWPQRFDPVFGTSVIGLILLLAIALFGGLMGLLTARGTREPKPAYPLMYAPPEGIGPAQAKYLFTETIGKDAFVASIMQTAEKGATTLDRTGGWTITDTGQGGELAAARPGLGVRRPGARRAGRIVHRRHQRLGRQEAEERAVEVRRRRAGLGPAEQPDDRRRARQLRRDPGHPRDPAHPVPRRSSTRSASRSSR